MDSNSGKPSLRKNSLSRRSMPRTSVLWSGIICEPNGANPFDCTIRNISDGGAEVSAKKTMAVGDRAFLLVTRNQVAYLSSVTWVRDERVGLTFSQVHEVGPKLPTELKFLRYILVQTKLRQMLGLVQRGIPLDEAARIVGWTDEEIEQLADVPSPDHHADFLVRRTRQLFKK